MILFLMACTGEYRIVRDPQIYYGDNDPLDLVWDEWASDKWDKPEIEPIDILYVIDDSCSMNNDREALVGSMDRFARPLLIYGIDAHIAIATTECHPDDDMRPWCDPVIWFTTNPDLENQLTFAVDALFANGSDNEMGLLSLQAALHFPKPWARQGVELLVIMITDEHDYSPIWTDADAALEADAEWRGMLVDEPAGPVRPRSDVTTVAAVVPYVGPGLPADPWCAVEPAVEYEQLARRWGGPILDLCQIDWGPILDGIVGTFVPENVIYLHEDPILSTLTVHYEVDGIETVSTNTDIWWYEPENHAVHITEYLPGDIWVEYKVVPY